MIETLRFADFHVHTNYSADAPKGYPARMVDAAAATGIHVIAITDHNSVAVHADGSGEWISEYAHKKGVQIIRGMEWTEEWKHLLLINIDPTSMRSWLMKNDIPEGILVMKKPKYPLRDTLQFVIDNGGATIVPHPGLVFGSMGFRELRELSGKGRIHGVEIDNGAVKLGTKFDGPYGAYRAIVEREVRDLGISLLSNSDAHTPDRIGSFSNAIAFDEPISGVSIVDGIKQGTIFSSSMLQQQTMVVA
jgi:predicted metal-dependent phosphoesterase TrpH